MTANGAWRVHGQVVLHTSPWLQLEVADVEAPSGMRHAYDVVRAAYDGAAALVTDSDRRVLLVWRHRFIAGTWAWELPAGGVNPGEHPISAAVREVREETGWLVRDARLVWSLTRLPERSDHRGHLIHAHPVTQEGTADPDEATEIHWWPPDQLGNLIASGQVTDVFSVAALLWWLQQPGGSR